MTSCKTLLLACAMLAVSHLHAALPVLNNSIHISSAEGLPCNQVFDMVQDADGYIWMATASGLCRYDGYRFLNYYKLGVSGTHAVVGYLILDDDQRHLWLQTSTFTFACYDLYTGTFVDYTGHQDETRTYRKFLKGRNGVIWMYDDESGVRRVKANADGTIRCTDYLTAEKTLPHNHVCDAFEDEHGQLWVMTFGGLTIINAEGKAHIINKEYNYLKGISIGNRRMMLTDRGEILTYSEQGKLLRRTPVSASVGKIPTITASFAWQQQWFIMTREGTFRVTPSDGKLQRADAPYQIANGTLMQSFHGNHFISNATGTLWIFPAEGEMRRLDLMEGLQLTTERFRRYNIALGADGLYYIASHGNGLFVYDLRQDAIRHYSATDTWPLLSSNFLNNVLVDRSGCVWLSEESMGITSILPANRYQVRYYYPKPSQKGDWSNYVRMVSQKDSQSVLLSTKDNHLYELNIASGELHHVQQLPSTAYTIFWDSKGRQWMGTRGAGLYIDGRPVDFPPRHIYDIVEDSLGRYWIATWGDGLLLVTLRADGSLDYKQYMKRTHNERNIRCVKMDASQRLWIASNNGVYCVDTRKPDITEVDLSAYNTLNEQLPFDEIICLATTRQGDLWVGSRGGGLLRCRPQDDRLETVKAYTTHEGLATDNISSITEDRQGNLWIGTDNGLTRIGTDQKVNSYQFGQTPQGDIFSEDCATLLSNGQLLLGTAYGLIRLSPEQAPPHSAASGSYTPVITTIGVNGISQYLSARQNTLSLHHQQNAITLNFSCLDYAGISSTQYQYYMEGLEQTWLPLASVNQVSYNGLRPGHYRFHLRALNQDNQWSEETLFDIHIRQPWYNTWWARLFYLLILAAVATYFYRSWRRNFELQQQIKMEKELTNFRLRFFTHIAHEFRTPLAIISGAADTLAKAGTEPAGTRAAVQTIRRGTKRLLKLVNQFMEFRRINTGNAKLNVEQLDLIPLVRNVYQEFWDMAKQKEQTITFTPFERHYEMVADPHIIETVLYNLLSNAVKYTPNRGAISLRIKTDDDRVLLVVEDNGPGITPQQMPQLFQPFMHGYVSQGGMGIGLYTAYHMATIHKGTLTYERLSDDGGSRFTLSLPASESVYHADDYATTLAIHQQESPDSDSGSTIRELHPEAYNDCTIAIIEDDPDMQEHIRGSIGRYFKTVGYSDGQSAVSGIRQQLPDLIICDVMLPDINGYDIVRQLRADESTCHIPTIMLTALDDDQHLLQGYKAGADDYLVKPCNLELLLLRVIQLIQWYRQRPTTGQVTEESTPRQTIITDEADRRFREKVEIAVARHMGEPNFTVDTLATLMRMGRTKFYGKMKDLTGLSPNIYLQTKRLERAAELLIEGDLNVTEISYKVGFQTPSYFYKCFKEKYGVPPSKYGKKG